MKRLLLIAVSVSLLGLSGAALAKSPHNDGDDGRLHSKWENSEHRNSSGHHNRHDNGRRHDDRERWSRHDRDRDWYRYDHHREHSRVVYVTPRDRYRHRPDVYFGLVLGPHGAFQYIQRW